MTHVPSDLIEQTARVVDQHAFSASDPRIGEPTRTRRQAAARHKAAYIIKLVIEQLAAAQDEAAQRVRHDAEFEIGSIGRR